MLFTVDVVISESILQSMVQMSERTDEQFVLGVSYKHHNGSHEDLFFAAGCPRKPSSFVFGGLSVDRVMCLLPHKSQPLW